MHEIEIREMADPEFLGDICFRFSGQLETYALNLTGDMNEAEDLVQTTWCRAAERSGELKKHPNMLGWLMLVVHNEFISGKRRRRPLLVGDDVALLEKCTTEDLDAILSPPHTPDISFMSDPFAGLRLLVNRLATLSPRFNNQLVTALDMNGISRACVAKKLGITRQVFRRILCDVRQELLEELTKLILLPSGLFGLFHACSKMSRDSLSPDGLLAVDASDDMCRAISRLYNSESEDGVLLLASILIHEETWELLDICKEFSDALKETLCVGSGPVAHYEVIESRRPTREAFKAGVRMNMNGHKTSIVFPASPMTLCEDSRVIFSSEHVSLEGLLFKPKDPPSHNGQGEPLA